MLIPVQTTGTKPTLLMVHGMFGIVPWRTGRRLAEFLGPDHPIYGLQAPGFDGGRKPSAKVPEAANEYLREIRRARLKAPFAVLGVCGGCVMALQLAQSLAVAARFAGEPPPVPLLMLIDPPGLPGAEYNPSDLADAAQLLRERVGNWFADTRERLEEVPFDIDDPKQLAIAQEVGAAVEWSISTYHPTPYSEPVQVLAIEPVAQMVDRPHWPWRKVLAGPWGIQTLQCQHQDIFSTRAQDAFRWVKECLDALQAPSGKPTTGTRPSASP